MVCRLNNRGKRQIQNPVSTWFSTELLNGDYEQIQHGTPQQICGDRLAELDVRVRLFFACARSEYSPLELSPVNHMFTLTWVPAWSTPVLSHVFWSCMWYHRLDWAWDSTNIILLVVNSCKSHMIFKYFPSLVGYLSHFFWFKAKSFGGVTPTRAELGTWDVAPPVASSARVATGPREAPIDD